MGKNIKENVEPEKENRKIVLIAGGSGMIGQRVAKLLNANNYAVRILSRSLGIVHEYQVYLWDIKERYIEKGALDDVYAVINLSGENIAAHRWTPAQKRKILNSRTESTKLLFEEIAKQQQKPEVYVSASAIGYYGTYTSEKILEESDDAGNDFLAEVCKAWEEQVDKFQNLDIRTVKLRTGVVLAKSDSVLQRQLLTKKIGFINAIGTGEQYMPWIHVKDIARLYQFAIENVNLSGAYNAVSPCHITQNAFVNVLKERTGAKLKIPNIPVVLVKLLFGEMASIILDGSRISSQKIINAGFQFQYPKIKDTIDHLIP